MASYGTHLPDADEEAPLLVSEEVSELSSGYVEANKNGKGSTLDPPGRRLKRNAQITYNPYDWHKTLFVVDGRIYISRAFFVICGIGTLLVILSGVAGIGLETNRRCRAWCSRFALGSQPHAYIGFVLFLIISFRTGESYRMYASGQRSHYIMKAALRRFVNTMLNRVSRDAIPKAQRARMLAFAIAFPYAVTADLRQERKYDKGAVDGLLCENDMRSMLAARSMPLFVLESLSTMVRTYCESCDSGTVRQMHTSLDELVAPYGECERIRHNPFAFAYVAHLRLLIVMYIVTLPLALVEQMGFSTIPVFWTICYSLMSLEMLAVEVENPFGHGRSDLPLFEYNLLIKESLLESWERWQLNLEACACSEQIQEKYNNLGVHCSNSACVASYGEGDGAGESGYW